MKKPDSLRERLSSVLPELARDPNRLRLWIEEGNVRCHAGELANGGNLNFTIEYTLTVVIEGWRHSSLLIWIVVLDWLRIQQPDLLTVARSAEALGFEADLISSEETDISFDLPLSERIGVSRRSDGGFDMQVYPEADPFFPDTVPFIPNGEPLHSIWLDGSQLVPQPGDA